MALFVTIVHIITCLLLILVILIQSGKGAEISASFAGSSQTVFGSSGGANFFVRFTQGAAAVFFITSLGLTLIGSQSKKSLFEGQPIPSAGSAQTAPATTSAPAADSGRASAPASAAAGSEAPKK